MQATVVIPGVTGPWNILIVPSSTGFSSVGSSSVETSAPKALVINRTSNNVAILNLSTDQSEGTVEVGTNPEQGDFDEELPRAIVTNFGSNDVSFVDTSSVTASLSVPVRQGASGCGRGPAIF